MAFQKWAYFCAILISPLVWAATSPAHCDSCDVAMEAVWSAVKSMDQKPAPTPSKPLFLQRLEAHHRYLAGKARLNAIRETLQELERELADEKQSLENEEVPPHVKQLEHLTHSQRLILEELETQLDEIHRRFQALDERIDAHEMRVEAVQGGLEKLEGEFANLAKDAKAHVVSKEETAYPSVTEFVKGPGVGATPRQFWRFPRSEVRFEELSHDVAEVTTSVSGNLYGIYSGSAKGGINFEVRLSTEAYLLSPGVEPLLSPRGTTLRDAVLFCATSKSYRLRGFGGIEGSVGVNLWVVNVSTSTRFEVGETLAASSKKYSDIVNVKQGATVSDQLNFCRGFTRQVATTDILEREIRAMTKVTQIPDTRCYSDYDCRTEVYSEEQQDHVVGQCFVSEDGVTSLCAPRSIGEKCTPEGKRERRGSLPCAKGYRCEENSRSCLLETSPQQHLLNSGLEEAQVVFTEAPLHLIAPGGKYDPSFVCEAFGNLPSTQGWRLPKSGELENVSKWFKGFLQSHLRKTYPLVSAQGWFHPAQAQRGMVWSSEPWVYLLATQSMARLDPHQPHLMEQFVDPESGETANNGVAICVRPKVPR